MDTELRNKFDAALMVTCNFPVLFGKNPNTFFVYQWCYLLCFKRGVSIDLQKLIDIGDDYRHNRITIDDSQWVFDDE